MRFQSLVLLAASILGLVDANDDNYKRTMLAKHNEFRRMHNVPELKWNSEYESMAVADTKRCSNKHSNEGKDFGQNMAWRFTPGDNPSDIDVALIGLQNWYNEEEYFRGKYSQSNPSGDNWFHFTQMVWKGTTDMGCATKRCGNSEIDWVTVCNYSEQGNFYGEFQDNVFAP